MGEEAGSTTLKGKGEKTRKKGGRSISQGICGQKDGGRKNGPENSRGREKRVSRMGTPMHGGRAGALVTLNEKNGGNMEDDGHTGSATLSREKRRKQMSVKLGVYTTKKNISTEKEGVSESMGVEKVRCRWKNASNGRQAPEKAKWSGEGRKKGTGGIKKK